MKAAAATSSWPSTGRQGGVKGVSELVQWTNSALNGRSPGVIRIFTAKTAANARRVLRDLERTCPIRIRTILTDNGKEFTDRLFGLRKRAATGAHEFDKLCASLDIDHRLTPPKSPQTNGMVERFNGRIEEVLQSHHFRSGEELETTLLRYVWLYNQQLPQSALGSKSPLQAMKDWHKLKPELFKKQPYYLTGCDTYIKWECQDA